MGFSNSNLGCLPPVEQPSLMRQPAKWDGISLNMTLIQLKEKRDGRDHGH